ncbi:MAG: zinc ribbon domain-containing protein, partial [Akkermansiaceae bacterium]|nr:zinc ribbon domain-containing protein [Armatimonadota bacterium]
MSNSDLVCPACGRANPPAARTCGNCSTVLAVTANGEAAMTDAQWKRLSEQETIYAAELGTVQGGAWGGVSTSRKSGQMPLPPQVQAESLRREREEAHRKAVQARADRERAELERRRAEVEARQRSNGGRLCLNCGTPAPANVVESTFSFCLNCGASFADGTEPAKPESVMPTVPPIPTVTSPVGVLRQQARREVQQAERYSERAETSYPVAPGSAVRVARRTDVLPVTEATPYVAAILSFLLPGAGQLRNAQWGKGFALLLATFVLL